MLVPYSNVRVKTDVPRSVLAYVSERPEQFPGVKVEQAYLRDYPHDTLGAQILGYVGQIGPAQLKQDRYRGVKQGTVVGQDGLERTYDKYLRGKPGVRRIQVDANGRPIPNRRLKDSKPVAGQRLRLSLDLGLEKEGANAIAGPLNPSSNPGAFVAMDPRDGQLLAMGSFPTFDPAIFTKPITEKRYKALTGDGGDDGPGPIFNRAIAGGYPTASTMKPITALAGLDKGLITPSTTIDDPGCIQVGEAERCNANSQAYGSVDLARALQVSSDVYFYKLGMNAFYRGDEPGKALIIQRWARRLGLDRPTGHRPARRHLPRRHDPRSEVARRDQRARAHLPREEADLGQRDRQAGGRCRLRALGPARLQPRRHRQPRDRPGRRAGLAAADGDRVRGDRERRQGRPAAPRPRDREPGRRARPAHRARAGAQGQDRSGSARRRAKRPAPRRERARRHVVRRVRRLEPRRVPDLRQDRHGADLEGRPVLVPRLRARPETADRRRGHRRAGAASAPPSPRRSPAGCSRSSTARTRAPAPPGRRRRDERARRLPPSRRPAPAVRPAARARRDRAHGRVDHLAEPDERRPRRPARVRDPPGDLLRDRHRPGRHPEPPGLLAPARAEVRRLRADDGRDPARHGLRRRHARLAARDPAAVLRGPGVRARQGPARRGAGGVRRRPRPRAGGARHDGAARARRHDPGDRRHGGRSRVRPRLHRDPVRRAVRRGRELAALRRD